MIKRTTLLPLLAGWVALGLGGCVAVPSQLEGEYVDLSPARVQPSDFGTAVRWGGVLVDTRNESDRTCFEVLSRDLDRYMRPIVGDQTAGRFIACTGGFHDPEIYAEGREVTITGVVKSLEDRRIEEFDYRYPVLEITDSVLWEKRRTVMMYRPYHDPFYDRFYWGNPYWGHYPYYLYPSPYYYRGYYGGYYGGYHGGGVVYPRELTPQPSEILSRDE